ncbi:MAG: hypothetical protein Q9161_007200 [Pseudevernia consocians]
MVPPPITPSPHRFITSRPANPTHKPSSSLRFQQGALQSTSPQQQFTLAPRFNFSSTLKSTTEKATIATQQASLFAERPHLAGTTQNKSREDIEQTGSDEEEAKGLENNESTFNLPVQPTSKRRRPNPPEATVISSHSPPPSPPPATPPYPTIEEDDLEAVLYNDLNSHARPRFVIPTPKPTGTPSIPSRPPLILPPRSPSPTATTPTFFSPHRRGQKYVPGGLASSVRDWIVETSQQAHNRAHARRGEEEFWDISFRVRDCRVHGLDEGMTIVQGRSEAKRWMLVGQGTGETKVEVGCMMGIREPTWEVLVGHELYKVAIEWRVLNG